MPESARVALAARARRRVRRARAWRARPRGVRAPAGGRDHGAPSRRRRGRGLAADAPALDARRPAGVRPAFGPFDRTARDPGYIKGYVPGVRENGAQYTHAALWTALAAAELGDGDLAFHLLDMLNPLTHARTPAEVATYKVEPYVVAADVYTAGHVGRGGWTWYTGSASWSYRVALEGVLGFRKRGDRLTVDRCVPAAWGELTIAYRYGGATYAITVRNPDGISCGVAAVAIDGRASEDGAIALVDDGTSHDVVVTLGRRPAAAVATSDALARTGVD